MSEKELVPHQKCVVAERDELNDKFGKLHDFTISPMFGELEEAERVRLSRQILIMKLYQQVLTERIAAF